MRYISPDLDPVFVPPVQNVLSVRVLQDQTFPSGLHDDLHTLFHILGGLTLKLSNKLNAALPLSEASTEVTLAKLARLVEERLAIEVQQIKNLDFVSRQYWIMEEDGGPNSMGEGCNPSSICLHGR